MTYLDNWLYSTLTPTTMIAIVAVFGYMIGKVKICGVSLDMAGVLLAAVLYGALSSRCQTISISGAQIFLYSEQFSANLSFLSGLGTALFISAVGIPGGEKLIGSRSRRNLQYLLTGVLTVLAGAVCILIISYIDGTVGFSGMIGIFSGALTSTPALAAAKEFPSVNVSELTVGYGASYVISVIGTVLFVQIIHQKADESCHYKVDSDRKHCPEFSHSDSLLLILANMIIGSMIGSVRFPGIDFSLGISGGILTIGLLLGGLMCRFRRCCSQAALQTVRNIGLIFFLIGMGIPAGVSLTDAMKPAHAVYGAITTLTAVIVSWLAARYIFKMGKTDSLAVVCGGMTSTPAIGVLYGKTAKQYDIAAYAVTYTGSLFSLVIGVRLLHAIFT